MSTGAGAGTGGPWPELPWSQWRDTATMLHMASQILGKVRLARSPHEPHWNHVALHVTASGLTTGPMPHGDRTFQLDLDLVDHRLAISDSRGARIRLPLGAGPVAAVYRDTLRALDMLGLHVGINPCPQEVPDPVPFPEDATEREYRPEHAARLHEVLLRVHDVLGRFRAGYRGPHTPVQLFWGGFDLSYARFSGRPASAPPGSGRIEREAMDSEQVVWGFWPGSDDRPEPGFFAYGHPATDGLARARVEPAAATWHADMGEFVLPYDSVRVSRAPAEQVLAFLGSTWRAATSAGRWPEPAS